ncbi:patatin-like phospholipase family protein [Wenzhouxiangella sediminis]|uniref:Patatin-like phospholipase family protein n=1 Tax=Wenzhouxiangella sediminis TaxID=1792836 RepID=A0A3E1K7F4_9GAMM|nr:patatin-like phospholipase family protein [Wenzhouxiangella sediminis]RFF29966.1 patatin-like phospholipase family protein [Wenzhouxiangella sediminis]
MTKASNRTLSSRKPRSGYPGPPGLLAGALCWLALVAGTPAAGEAPETAAEAACAEPDVALVLGSGGAAGLGHIAMLRAFEEQGIRPAAVAGTSIGAIVGTLFAAGLDSAAIESLFRDFGGSAFNPFAGWIGDAAAPGLRELIEIDLGNGSLLDSNRFTDFVAERMSARQFADTQIPLYVVATDFWSGEARVLRNGDLLQAMRASMAVPGVFAPVPMGEDLLIDGGASNPLPVDVVADHDIVVAIDVTGSRRPGTGERPDISDLLFSSFEIMQQSIIRARLREYPADIYIKPELDDIRMLHFDRVDEILERTRPAARELAERLRELTAQRCAGAGAGAKGN